MNQYLLKTSLKVKLLNGFRILFTKPPFEKFLVNRVSGKSPGFWRKFIPPDYLYKKGSFRQVTRKGIKYKLDVSNVIDHYVYWAAENTGFNSALNELKAANVILDIGANIGSTALYFASINPGAEIFAFEPDPVNYKRATENIQLNSFKNIYLVNIGLGEKNEIQKLYEVNEHNPGMNRLTVIGKDFPFKEVKISRLDDFCRERKLENVDFIKIDVEGFEYFVLAGGEEIVKKSKPVLFVEVDDIYLRENNKSAKELIDLLVSFGYKRIYRADNLEAITTNTDFKDCHYDIIAKCN